MGGGIIVLVECCHVVSEVGPGSGLEGAGGGRELLGDLGADPRTRSTELREPRAQPSAWCPRSFLLIRDLYPEI